MTNEIQGLKRDIANRQQDVEARSRSFVTQNEMNLQKQLYADSIYALKRDNEMKERQMKADDLQRQQFLFGLGQQMGAQTQSVRDMRHEAQRAQPTHTLQFMDDPAPAPAEAAEARPPRALSAARHVEKGPEDNREYIKSLAEVLGSAAASRTAQRTAGAGQKRADRKTHGAIGQDLMVKEFRKHISENPLQDKASIDAGFLKAVEADFGLSAKEILDHAKRVHKSKK
jgi:hypothetical protein